jgi:Cu-Zn family superoxide dismutase
MSYRILAPCILFLITLITAHAEEKSVDIIGEQGHKIGVLDLQQGPHGLLLHLSIDKGHLSPGWHGVHFHEVGDCSDHGAFMNAKGHINPRHKEHGFLNSKGPHPADLPNIYVAEDGSSHSEFHVYGLSLQGGKLNLLSKTGSALIIHANPDDHKTQPIGGTGPRVACAVIK